jgi:aspartyl-tRNA synthetase
MLIARRLFSGAATSGVQFGRRFRTHYCAQVGSALVGQRVLVSGWVQHCRVTSKDMAFVVLRDESGLLQVKLRLGASSAAPSLESVLCVRGTVHARPPGQHTGDWLSGQVELDAEATDGSASATLLNRAVAPLPLPVVPVEGQSAPREEARLRYRHLDLRGEHMQRNLRLRSDALFAARAALHAARFTEVETPTLFRHTSEGAREFVVPTRQPGRFYALPQSPQQYKQLLVIGGVPRYFQVARCYRDEATRADRQPEFTQLDMEMAFADAEDIMAAAELVATSAWRAAHPQRAAELQAPFARMKHADAMRRFGVDKPDLRYDLELHDASPLLLARGVAARVPLLAALPADAAVQAVVAPQLAPHLTRTRLDQLCRDLSTEAVRVVAVPLGGGALSGVGKQLDAAGALAPLQQATGARADDVILLCVSPSFAKAQAGAGAARIALAGECQRAGVLAFRPDAFVWIVDFPLFEEAEDGSDGIKSAHHPFTAPVDAHLDALRDAAEARDRTRLLQLRAQHYDLVLNGVEIAGGSVRIHDATLQRLVFDCLRLSAAQVADFAHLLQALSHGAPPHAGIAFGVDRLMSILCGVPSIRDVIAFPKTANGNELLTGAPAPVDDAHLAQYHIRTLPLPTGD